MIALLLWLQASNQAGALDMYLWVAGITIAVRVAVNISFGLYARSWRFASIGDMGRIVTCVLIGSAAAATIVSLVTILNQPATGEMPSPSFWLMDSALALAVMATPRFLIRAASDLASTMHSVKDHERTLLYGAGWAGVIVARSAERHPDSGVTPVGFLDDNPGLKGRRVAGLLVYGDAGQLARATRRSRATSLLITMPRADGETVRNIVEAGMELGLDVRTVPPVTDLIDGTIDASRIRQVRVEDLLRRPLASHHSEATAGVVTGHTVMVTGAAGSIGSELVRQLVSLNPRRIVMVDQAESPMYMVARNLESREQVQQGEVSLSTHLLDVTDRTRMAELMADTKPDVVFHVAAYKHVPMLEDHVSQAVRVNIGGTMSVVDAAADHGVERFVLVSTDKAVRPSSAMGASKRAAEMIVADAARRTSRAYVSVRFGNVLGSNGSVVPIFQEQLENGQPLTITDPEMTRYFMTIPEAAWLIIDAAAISWSGGLFVLDMGEPVRIMDIARDLTRLAGRDPATVPIKITGLRPGEKLHEELFYTQEEAVETEVPKVLRTQSPEPPLDLRDEMIRLLGMAKRGDQQTLKVALHEYVTATAAGDSYDWSHPEGTPDGSERLGVGGYHEVVPVKVHANANGNGNGHSLVLGAGTQSSDER